jgi:uridine kinase
MNATGKIILLYGTSSAGKSSINRHLKNLLVDVDAVFVSVDEISWKPLIEQAKIFNLINDQMPKEEQYRIMMQHIDMLDVACGDQWVVCLKNFYDKVKQLALTHEYVVLDTVFYVDGDADAQYFLEQMRDIPKFCVLVYAPQDVIAQRVVQRNTGMVVEQKRDVVYALTCLYDLYVPVSTEQDSIGVLTKQEVERAWKIIENYWIEFGMSEQSIEKKITELKNLYEAKFFANQYDSVFIAPRFDYDMMVNTAKFSSQECAEQIKEAFLAHVNQNINYSKHG